MVLVELGSKITAALSKMSGSVVLTDAVVDDMIKAISKALLDADVNVRQVKQLQVAIHEAVANVPQGHNKRKQVQAVVVKELYRLLEPPVNMNIKRFIPEKKGRNVVMFVGLQGSGKTTTCMKYAAYYKKKGFKVAMVCADTFRAGAFDQLKQNAILVGVHYYGSYTEYDPAVVAEEGVEKFKADGFDLIIVDTSGRHKQEAALFTEMQEIAKVVQPDHVIFVMDGGIGQGAREHAQAFKAAIPVGSVIITKLDGHARGGGALSAVAATQAPIIFIGLGEHVDDLQEFDAKSFVQRLLGMGDIKGLFDLLAADETLLERQRKSTLMAKLTTGQPATKKPHKKDVVDFTFRDLYEQMQMMLSLGNVGKMIAMMPGITLPAGMAEGDWQKKMQRFMVVMDSMHESELDSDARIFNGCPSRVERVARGSGVSISGVQEVLQTFKPFQNLLRGLRDSGLSNMNLPALMGTAQGSLPTLEDKKQTPHRRNNDRNRGRDGGAGRGRGRGGPGGGGEGGFNLSSLLQSLGQGQLGTDSKTPSMSDALQLMMQNLSDTKRR